MNSYEIEQGGRGRSTAGPRHGVEGVGERLRFVLLGFALALPLLVVPSAAAPLAAQGYDELEARIWIDGAVSPVFRRGDRASVYYRATTDAYVAVFHIDTDGIVRLLHPRVPGEDHYVRRDRTYRLRFARSSYWYVDDYPGVGYFFIVASYRPMDFSSFRYSHVAGGWDLASVGRRVYQDPYLAMDDFVAALVPDWRTGEYALDFVEYHVDRRHDYPRFLCYDCHAFRPYRSWNPYRYQCHSFRLIVHTDPYFYPVTRYRGTRVVYTRPPVRNVPRFTFKERARGEPAAPIYQPASETGLPGVVGAERRRSTGQGGAVPGGQVVPRSPSDGGGAPGVAAPEARRRGSGAPGGATSGTRPGASPDAVPRGDDREPGSRPAPRAAPRAEQGPEPRRPSDAIGGPRREGPDPTRPDGLDRSRPEVAAPPRAPSVRVRDGDRSDDPRTRAPAPDPDPPRPFLERRTSPSRDSGREPTARPRDGRPSAPAPRGPSPSTRRPSGGSDGASGGRSRETPSRPSTSPAPRSGSSRPSASPSPRGGGSRPSASPAPRGGGRSGGSPQPRGRPRPR